MENKYKNTEKDIHERIFKYVVVGLKVIKHTQNPRKSSYYHPSKCLSHVYWC